MARRGWTGPLLSAVFVVAAVATTALTIWFSLAQRPPRLVGTDKDLHAFAYAVNALAILLAVGWRPVARRWRSHAWTAAVAAALLAFGGLLELVQRRAGRTPDVRDWIADAVGIAGGVAAYVVIRALAAPVDSRPDPATG
jgi:VanZ family protein